MKKLTISAIMFLFLFISYSFAQYTTTKTDGGSVVTNLGSNIKVNDGSTLNREWINLNTSNCPIQLKDVGIMTAYSSSKYEFNPKGELSTNDTIVAYEIHHVLYDVFGNHIKTLSNFDVKDYTGNFSFSKYSSWYANGNNVSEYLICVSYVAYARTKNGKIWRYNYSDITTELNKIEMKYDEDYSPNSEKD